MEDEGSGGAVEQRVQHRAAPVLTTDALVGRQHLQEPTSLDELVANDPDPSNSQDTQVGIIDVA